MRLIRIVGARRLGVSNTTLLLAATVSRRMPDDTLAGEDTFTCETCGRTVGAADAIRRETIGDLDPATWQPPCCPDCGSRLQTVFVGDE